MFKSPLVRTLIGILIAIGILALIRFKPWQRTDQTAQRQQLSVGFLPVT